MCFKMSETRRRIFFNYDFILCVCLNSHDSPRTQSQKVRLYQYIVLIRFWNILIKRQKIWHFLNYSIEILRGCYRIAMNEQFKFKFLNNYQGSSSVPSLEKVFTFLLFNVRVSDSFIRMKITTKGADRITYLSLKLLGIARMPETGLDL